MAAGVFTPYSTVDAFLGTLPAWVPPEDKQRIAAYQVYEEIYWNVPTTFKLVHRGTENRPIYLPSGRIIVETFNRYFCKGFNYQISPLAGTPADQENAALQLNALFAREQFFSKFKGAKRNGLIHGDWAFHITADPLKAPGTRISINIVDPGSLFKVYGDELHPDRVTKIHLAELFLDVDGTTTKVRRQT